MSTEQLLLLHQGIGFTWSILHMAKKILFYFSGTGDTAERARKVHEDGYFNDDVVRIYFNGAQDSNIGGLGFGLGYISPNLDVVASKIRSCFYGHFLSIDDLVKEFSSSIIIEPNNKLHRIEVESIALAGFSRGAVTTFSVARYLDHLDLPIRLFAEDPVPGESQGSAKNKSSEFYKNHDLRACRNISLAMVMVGAYARRVNLFHDNYFQQMVPLFPATCTKLIYKTPRPTHFQRNNFVENHKTDYLILSGLKTQGLYYSQVLGFFLPKIEQQSDHIGVLSRSEVAVRYKLDIFKRIVISHPELTKDFSFKIGQALYALDQVNDFQEKPALLSICKTDSSANGKALREFVVEFENILSYVFRNKTLKQLNLTSINEFKIHIYKQLFAFLPQEKNPVTFNVFKRQMAHHLNALKEKIPATEYNIVKEMLQQFLDANVISHPQLTEYIDETETFHSKPLIVKRNEFALLDIAHAENAEELAEMLYNMSEDSRYKAFPLFAPRLGALCKDYLQLSHVLRFLSPEQIGDVLVQKRFSALINSLDKVNYLMANLFTISQRQVVYAQLKSNIKTMRPQPPQVKIFTDYINEFKVPNTNSLFPLVSALGENKTDKKNIPINPKN